jgi:IPT/TIG domain-containing protein/peptidase M66-like protein
MMCPENNQQMLTVPILPGRRVFIRLAACNLLLAVMMGCGGGGMTSPSAPPPAAPSISNFSPGSGPTGMAVIITGTNLTGATSVKFNGMVATYTVSSATQISTSVPSGATSGKISVITAGGTATSTATFTVTAPAPTITNFTPTSGLAGSSVTVMGTNFTGATAVSFNGTAATFSISSATQMTTTVPAGATTGPISITTPGGAASSASNFTVTVPAPAPTLSSFSPASGAVGITVNLSGTNFTGASSVKFNGVSSTFAVNSGTSIVTSVPVGAATGKISVTTPGGTATSASNFTVTSVSGLDLTIDGLYVTQATQNYPAPAVPLVKDRSAWVRVFVLANQANTVQPQVRVRFINGATTNTLTIVAPGSSVPTSVNPGDAAGSWNTAVPSGWIQPGVQVVADVDPTAVIAEADKTNNQFSMNLDVRSLKTWKITLLSVHTGDGLTGVVENASRDRNAWIDFAKRLHPVPDAVDVTVGSTMNSSVATLSSTGTGWSTVLNELNAKRTADGATDRYYYGVVKVNYTSGVAGLGFVGAPAAIGWDLSSGPSVLAHEVGHNFGRPHSPCGGASSPDPNYPYAGGLIGVTGWDVFATSNNLKNAATYTDVMGYCNPQWISDYVYTSVLNFRSASSLGLVAPAQGRAGEGLLVWGRIEDGQMILEPAFRVPVRGPAPQPGPYVWQGRDTFGQTLAQVSFDAPEVADLPNGSVRLFSFIVPMSAQALRALRSVHVMQDGAELARRVRSATTVNLADQAGLQMQDVNTRTLQLYWDAAQAPVVMLRDATTGEVRGFLRGGIAQMQDVPADLEVQLSDGVSSQAVRHQRPPQ